MLYIVAIGMGEIPSVARIFFPRLTQPPELSVTALVLQEMGRLFLIDLEGRRYSCIHCDVALALYSDVLSKSYTCRDNKAYFFENVVNVTTGEPKEWWTVAGGQFMLSDIFCVRCGSLLGFKHVTAFEAIEKYKEGRYVVERDKVYGHYILTNNGRFLGSDNEESGEEEDEEDSNDEESDEEESDED